MSLKPGVQFGPYEILAAAGAGGMGEVYKARDTRLDRSVAVKILPAADPDRRARFEREARSVAALSHPHICTLHDVGQHDGIDFLVMEFVDGVTIGVAVVGRRRCRSTRRCGSGSRWLVRSTTPTVTASSTGI